MSSLSVMEWNAKTPSQWEWENSITLGTKATENPKKSQSADWWMEGIGVAVSGLSYSPGGGAGGSRSDLGYTSSTKSSKSPSVGSPSIGEIKISQPYYDSIEGIPEEFCNRAKIEQNGTSPVLEASVGSGEPLLSLKLGKQAYSEDVSGRGNAKSSSYTVIPVPSLNSAKRLKSSSLNTNPPRCQVEGCNLDLSSAKDYHRKHRVCESHSKSPKVIVAGLERRFCQQCSRFHGLSEFDEKKRSCRKRLSDHNARRRKPQPQAVQLNSSSLASSFSDGRQPISLGWNKIPLFHSKPRMDISWGNTGDSRFVQPVKAVKTEGNEGQLNLLSSGASNITATLCHDSSGFYPCKGATFEVLNQGLPMTSDLDSLQDLHRAPSLLSTSSRASCEPKHSSLGQNLCANPSSMPQSAVHALAEGLPVALPDYWQSQQPEPQIPSMDSRNYCNSHFQDFPQQRATYEGAFHSWQFD